LKIYESQYLRIHDKGNVINFAFIPSDFEIRALLFTRLLLSVDSAEAVLFTQGRNLISPKNTLNGSLRVFMFQRKDMD
jgi:hypothetical protein